MNNKGFTLLEIIIVIIIVGVLAALALPRYINTVERSRATEAISNIGAIRQSLNRCYLQTNDFTNCDNATFTDLDIGDPNGVADRLFNYTFNTTDADTIEVDATRIGSGEQITLQIDLGVAGGPDETWTCAPIYSGACPQ